MLDFYTDGVLINIQHDFILIILCLLIKGLFSVVYTHSFINYLAEIAITSGRILIMPISRVISSTTQSVPG